jgi:hypothetical protein
MVRLPRCSIDRNPCLRSSSKSPVASRNLASSGYSANLSTVGCCVVEAGFVGDSIEIRVIAAAILLAPGVLEFCRVELDFIVMYVADILIARRRCVDVELFTALAAVFFWNDFLSDVLFDLTKNAEILGDRSIRDADAIRAGATMAERLLH